MEERNRSIVKNYNANLFDTDNIPYSDETVFKLFKAMAGKEATINRWRGVYVGEKAAPNKKANKRDSTKQFLFDGFYTMAEIGLKLNKPKTTIYRAARENTFPFSSTFTNKRLKKPPERKNNILLIGRSTWYIPRGWFSYVDKIIREYKGRLIK